MSNKEHLKILRSGRREWNAWREESPTLPDLRRTNLCGRNLSGYNLSRADLSNSQLWDTRFRKADLTGATLAGSVARFASLSGAKLSGANLEGTDLRAGSLRRADLTGANLKRAILRFTSLVEANVEGANLFQAEIYGIGVWRLKGEPADQREMIIQARQDSLVTTVDDLETAHFLFLIMDNPKLADIIDTASHRTVLLLGRFTGKRKAVLNALKIRLQERNFVPVLFDFERPAGRDLTETVASLAHMACFVIADLSGAKSLPQELSYVVPYLPSVPVIPMIQKDERAYAMFEHFQRYPWVQAPVRYQDLEQLLSIFDEEILGVGFRQAMKARGLGDTALPKLPDRG